MSILKKNKAITIDKMQKLTELTITEDTVKLHMQYSNITFKVEEIPALLSDVIQLYAIVKPILDKKELQKAKEKVDTLTESTSVDDDTPIDLSDIPF